MNAEFLKIVALVSLSSLVGTAFGCNRELALIVKALKPSVMGSLPREAELTSNLSQGTKTDVGFQSRIDKLKRLASTDKLSDEIREVAVQKIYDLAIDACFLQGSDLPRVVAVTPRESRRNKVKTPNKLFIEGHQKGIELKKELIELPNRLPIPSVEVMLKRLTIALEALAETSLVNHDAIIQNYQYHLLNVYKGLDILHDTLSDIGTPEEQAKKIHQFLPTIKKYLIDKEPNRALTQHFLGWAYLLMKDTAQEKVRDFAGSIYAWINNCIRQANFREFTGGRAIAFGITQDETSRIRTTYRMGSDANEIFQALPPLPNWVSMGKTPAVKAPLRK